MSKPATVEQWKERLLEHAVDAEGKIVIEILRLNFDKYLKIFHELADTESKDKERNIELLNVAYGQVHSRYLQEDPPYRLTRLFVFEDDENVDYERIDESYIRRRRRTGAKVGMSPWFHWWRRISSLFTWGVVTIFFTRLLFSTLINVSEKYFHLPTILIYLITSIFTILAIMFFSLSSYWAGLTLDAKAEKAKLDKELYKKLCDSKEWSQITEIMAARKKG